VLRERETPRALADAVAALGAAKTITPQSGEVLRTYGIGAQILKDLGIHRMRVLSAPKQIHGISAFGLEIDSYVDQT